MARSNPYKNYYQSFMTQNMNPLYKRYLEYLMEDLPDVSDIGGYFDVPTTEEREEESLKKEIKTPMAPMNQTRGGDSFSVYNPDPDRVRTSDDYNPYSYRQTMAKSGVGIPSGILADSEFLYGKKLPGIMGTAVDFIRRKLPVNPRAVLENEFLGKGFAVDDIGRIVGDPNTAEGIMAGYNAAKVTSKTFDKRRDAIMKGLMKTNPEAARERLALLDEAEAKMLGARGITKDILSDKYSEIDKYKFTGPNVQGNFYTDDDEDDEDEYGFGIFDPGNPGGISYASPFSLASRQETAIKNQFEYNRKVQEEAAKQKAAEDLRKAMEAQNISKQEAINQQKAIDRQNRESAPGRGDRGNPGGSSGQMTDDNAGTYCFDPNTLIQMADGSEKKIKEIQLGDQTKGGEVTGVFQFKASDEIHDYKGVTVAGSHYVKEDGKFIMVKDSPISVKIDKIPVVYSLDTTGRRIFINNIEFADYNGDGIAKGFLANAGVDLTGFDKEVLRQVENRLI